MLFQHHYGTETFIVDESFEKDILQFYVLS